MSSNMENFGKALNDQMRRMNRPGITAELGEIVSGMKLQPDFSPGPIPKGDYMVSKQLKMGKKDSEFANTTTDGTYPHSHRVKLPEELRSLKVGDRVLIIWVGTEPIVIDIVVQS